MAAKNKSSLAITAANVYIGLLDNTIPTLANDLSNAADYIAAITDLATIELGALTDVTFNIGGGDVVRTQTDNRGIIYSASSGAAQLTATGREPFDLDVLKTLLGVEEYDDTVNNKKYIGWVLRSREIPSLAIFIEGLPDAEGFTKNVYLSDAVATSAIALQFIDVARAGNPWSTALTIDVNQEGGFLVEKDIPATS